jgi:hypothetical protein
MNEAAHEYALIAAHKAVEEVLVQFRDQRISVLNARNGFVIREFDGGPSDIIRLRTRDGLRIGIEAYLAALKTVTT